MIHEHAIKFEMIAKGIRKQTKLKSQNEFILKENIYLKERISAFQKKIQSENFESMKPRKLLKT